MPDFTLTTEEKAALPDDVKFYEFPATCVSKCGRYLIESGNALSPGKVMLWVLAASSGLIKHYDCLGSYECLRDARDAANANQAALRRLLVKEAQGE